jgi:hypothetical protein
MVTVLYDNDEDFMTHPFSIGLDLNSLVEHLTSLQHSRSICLLPYGIPRINKYVDARIILPLSDIQTLSIPVRISLPVSLISSSPDVYVIWTSLNPFAPLEGFISVDNISELPEDSLALCFLRPTIDEYNNSAIRITDEQYIELNTYDIHPIPSTIPVNPTLLNAEKKFEPDSTGYRSIIDPLIPHNNLDPRTIGLTYTHRSNLRIRYHRDEIIEQRRASQSSTAQIAIDLIDLPISETDLRRNLGLCIRSEVFNRSRLAPDLSSYIDQVTPPTHVSEYEDFINAPGHPAKPTTIHSTMVRKYATGTGLFFELAIRAKTTYSVNDVLLEHTRSISGYHDSYMISDIRPLICSLAVTSREILDTDVSQGFTSAIEEAISYKTNTQLPTNEETAYFDYLLSSDIEDVPVDYKVSACAYKSVCHHDKRDIEIAKHRQSHMCDLGLLCPLNILLLPQNLLTLRQYISLCAQSTLASRALLLMTDDDSTYIPRRSTPYTYSMNDQILIAINMRARFMDAHGSSPTDGVQRRIGYTLLPERLRPTRILDQTNFNHNGRLPRHIDALLFGLQGLTGLAVYLSQF